MTTRLAAAVELSSGRGDARALHLPAVARAVTGGELERAAGHVPDGVTAPSGRLPRPCWGAGARQAHHVQARPRLGGHSRAWMHASVAAQGRRRATIPGPVGAPTGRTRVPTRRCSMRSDYGLDTPRAAHWSDRAHCQRLVAVGQADPDDWYPIREAADAADVKRAKRHCRECHVRAECLADALAAGEQYGIRGGLTSRERRALGKAVA